MSGVRLRRSLLHDRKLVAAEASNSVAFADRCTQPVGNSPQQGIANGMTQRVVDEFEAIQVDG